MTLKLDFYLQKSIMEAFLTSQNFLFISLFLDLL